MALFLLLPMAAENDEAEGKEGEDEGVFLWLRDGRAMDADAQALIFLMCGPTLQHSVPRPIAGVSVLWSGSEEVGQVKVSNRLVGHYRRPNPVHIRLARAVLKVTATHSRPDVIPTGVLDIVQMHSGDGAAAHPGEGQRRHIGGAAGNGDVVEGVGGSQLDGLPQTRAQRLQVPRRIGGRSREQRGQVVIGGRRERNWILQKGAGRFVRVAPVIVAAGADVREDICNGHAGARRAAENPEGSVGVVLAREDVDVQLRLGLVPPPPAKAGEDDQ